MICWTGVQESTASSQMMAVVALGLITHCILAMSLSDRLRIWYFHYISKVMLIGLHYSVCIQSQSKVSIEINALRIVNPTARLLVCGFIIAREGAVSDFSDSSQ